MIAIGRMATGGCSLPPKCSDRDIAIHLRIQSNELLERCKDQEKCVRSEIIFRANAKIENKFRLCQAASKDARRLSVSSGNTQETINKAFVSIAADSAGELLAGEELR